MIIKEKNPENDKNQEQPSITEASSSNINSNDTPYQNGELVIKLDDDWYAKIYGLKLLGFTYDYDDSGGNVAIVEAPDKTIIQLDLYNDRSADFDFREQSLNLFLNIYSSKDCCDYDARLIPIKDKNNQVAYFYDEKENELLEWIKNNNHLITFIK